ncbi:glycosyltransferase family 2 protein [Winogradskyella sp. F6397]|uniref:Glycosyltransferase family 2 protein n=1 Tax=Winogradskyella marina TaxID=2785530 RepID=A0ABS0ECX1_9FLAO|nr:glycosyltransferase family 2 protein [Winogradskyella marina]MBF8148298.1 glycosyltransferase family 2 protein [Winogradskyella marina]
MAFFSVVISVYNKEKHIQQTIESVLNQTFKDFEIIVINDGSTDNSENIISAYEDKRIKLITTANQGASNARNRGLKEATSNYIALLDGDDTWDASFLQHMYDAIQKFPELNIFSTGIAQQYENKVIPVVYNFKQQDLYGIHNFFQASQKYSLITSSSVVFNRSILDKTGRFDPTIVSGQDTDLWLRFGMHYEVLFINKVLAFYVFNPSSLSNTTFDARKKPKFDKYYTEEKQNKPLKLFLDRNRYSMAILSKIQDDKKLYEYYTSQLDSSSLSVRQNVLLNCPRWLLKLLVKIKSLQGEKIYYPKS